MEIVYQEINDILLEKMIAHKEGEYMSKKIIIINGHPAAGKTTFAMRLSEEFKIPYLAKNTFKNAVSASAAITDQSESSRFSAITFDAIIYVTERLMEVEKPLIIEGSFAAHGFVKSDGSQKIDEAAVIKSLIDKYDYTPLTYIFTGDTQILHKRFLEREKLNERGANAVLYEMTHDYFSEICRHQERFNIGGELIKIDTTDFGKVDFKSHIESARLFIHGNK